LADQRRRPFPPRHAPRRRLWRASFVRLAGLASNSRSAGQAIGESRLAAWTNAYAQDLPVFALGGVNTRTAPRLINTGLAGFAAIEAFAKSVDIG